MKFRSKIPPEKPHLQMTPMIDVVFQLMVFFVFTVKIVRHDGVSDALAGSLASPPAGGNQASTLQIKLRLHADQATRELSSIDVGEVALTGDNLLQQLQARVRELVDSSPATDRQAEIEADYSLKYRHVKSAIAAVTAYTDPVTGQRRKLVDKVRFAGKR